MAEEVKKTKTTAIEDKKVAVKPAVKKIAPKAEKVEKTEKTVKAEKVEKTEKTVKAEPKLEKAPKAVKAEPKLEKVEKPVKAEKAPETEKPVKAEKTATPAKKAKSAKKGNPNLYIATGRRKNAVARVRLIAGGTGKITVNGHAMEDYFMLDTLKLIVRQPLKLTDTNDKYDVLVNVFGGGYTGQTGAIRHGISRALVKESETYKSELKKAGFLSRDSRMKERKKYGLKKARKAPQFSKR